MAEKARKSKKGFPFVPFLLTAAVSAYIIYHLLYVLTPFLLSIALAYLCNPLISWFEMRGYKRSHAVVLFYILIFGLLSILANVFLPIANREWALMSNMTPSYLAKVQDSITSIETKFGALFPFQSGLLEQFTDTVYETIFQHVRRLPNYLMGLLPFLSLLFLVPFITFFLLLDGAKSLDRLIQACPSRYVEQSLYLLSEIEASLGNYLRGVVIIILAMGTASFFGLVAMGVDHALPIAILSGVSSVIPYLGPIMGAIVGGFSASFQFGTAIAGFKVVVLFTCLRLGDEAFVQPIVSKHAVKLHPLIYLLSLMVGGELFGFIGLLFAVPFTCVAKALLQVWWTWYTSEGYLGDASPVEMAVVPYT